MFGYVKTYTPELKVRENEYYSAVYCGLCRSLGKCTGCRSKLTLNYDFVFGALLRFAADGKVPEFEKKRCAVHPFRKRPMAKPCDELDFCARAGVLLAYRKAEDDIADECGGKRFRAKTARSAMRGMHKRAAQTLCEADKVVLSGLAGLAETEKQSLPSVDIPADCFGDTLGKLLSDGLDGTNKRIVNDAGRHLGRWLYIVDAADDYAEDIKKGRYNPFVLLYGGEPLDDNRRRDIFNALTAELMKLEAAVELLDRTPEQRDTFGLIENILHLGMPHVQDTVLYGKGKEKTK